MARMSRKELKQDEIADAAADAGHWLEEHWQTALMWAGAAIAAVLLVVSAVWWVRSARVELEKQVAKAQAEYMEAAEGGFVDADLLSSALDSLTTLAADNQGKAAGNLAAYYQALTLHRLGRSAEALPILESLVEGRAAEADSTMASANLLLVNLYQDADRGDDAIALLERVVESTTPAIPADQALQQLARIMEARGDTDRAQELWRKIRDEHGESSAANEARSKLTAG